MGDKNVIREYVTINRGTKGDGATVVGSNNFIMAYSHIAHDCIVGNSVIMANGATLAGHVTLTTLPYFRAFAQSTSSAR